MVISALRAAAISAARTGACWMSFSTRGTSVRSVSPISLPVRASRPSASLRIAARPGLLSSSAITSSCMSLVRAAAKGWALLAWPTARLTAASSCTASGAERVGGGRRRRFVALHLVHGLVPLEFLRTPGGFHVLARLVLVAVDQEVDFAALAVHSTGDAVERRFLGIERADFDHGLGLDETFPARALAEQQEVDLARIPLDGGQQLAAAHGRHGNSPLRCSAAVAIVVVASGEHRSARGRGVAGALSGRAQTSARGSGATTRGGGCGR